MENDRLNYLNDILHRIDVNSDAITISFGSNEFKYHLLNIFDSDEEYDEILKVLNIIILKYTFKKLSVGFKEGEIFDLGNKKSKPLYTDCISNEDCYDIAVAVFCEVVKKLDDFIKKIIDNEYNEKQRQAWLRKIVYCACAKFLNKTGRIDYIIDSEDDEEVTYIPVSEYKLPEYITVCSDMVRGTIGIACKAPFKPEKILGYLYNVMIFRELEGRKRNSSSTKTSEYMNDKILFILKEGFVPCFNQVYTINISFNDIDDLSKILGYDSATIAGEKIFSSTPKLITDWSNRMKTYLYKYKHNILDGEGVE